MEEAKSLLEIIKCFLYEKECINNNNINENKLYKLAKTNSVSNFLQNWAQKNCKSEEIKTKVYNDYTTQIVKDTNQNIELEKILNILEENKIKTLLVKGVLMKDIYPQNYMRQMCDIDILVNESDFRKATKLLKNMGFHKFYNEEKHLTFIKPPFIVVELHRKLILEEDIGYEYFNDIWPLCVKYNNYKNIYQLDLENAYVFCILHLLIHFKFAGIKIKNILDVYLYNEKYKDNLNYNKLNNILESLDIKEFEENIKNISYKWFKSSQIGAFNEIETFILKGIRIDNRVNYSLGKNNGKISFITQLLFPKMKIMKKKYTILEKFPLLLPIMWISRICEDIFSTRIPLKTRFRTIKLIKEADKKDIQKLEHIYRKLGIK